MSHPPGLSGSSARPEIAELPLCVELDRTLVRTDLRWECMAALLRRKPWLLLALPLWLWKSRAYLHERLGAAAGIDVAHLPYHLELLTWLRSEHARGRTLVLASAAPGRLVEAVAAHLGIFSRSLVSNPRQRLQSLRDGFPRGFDYCGQIG